jgi:probable HAF family extracellular repeat protein
MKTNKLTFVALLLIATVPLALAQGTYTQIDVPGAVLTVGLGINSAGDIVGYYEDAGSNLDGFLLSSGTYTTVNYSGSVATFLTGTNDAGQIVGFGSNPDIGFLYSEQTQEFTVILPPKADYAMPYAINNNGEIGGTSAYGNSHRLAGFVLAGSRYSVISPPHSAQAEVLGITAIGALFGSAHNKDGGTFSFSYAQGKYSNLSIPNAPNCFIYGVNPQGTALVGWYEPSSGVTAGFIYRNNVLTTLLFSGSSYTQALGINKAGEVVGYFIDADSDGHGFTWTPPAGAETK